MRIACRACVVLWERCWGLGAGLPRGLYPTDTERAGEKGIKGQRKGCCDEDGAEVEGGLWGRV